MTSEPFRHRRSRPARHTSRLALASAALLVPGTVLLNTTGAFAAPQSLVKINSTLPSWVSTTAAPRSRTAARSAERMSVRVYLAPKGGQAALEAKVAALSDPRSADYGHWLSVAQFRAAYSPTGAAADSVKAYLKSQGLRVGSVEAQRRYVNASGTVAQLQTAFHTTLAQFNHAGQSVTAPTTAAQLPASVAGSVLTVTGLDTTVVKMAPNHITSDADSDAASAASATTSSATTSSAATSSGAKVTPPDGFRNARPCSTYYGQVQARYQDDYSTALPKFEGRTLPYANCGYTGPYLRAAYEGATQLTGQGVTVAITDAYRWQKIASDANTYASTNGDGSYVAGQLTESLPPAYRHREACGPSGWSGEETLDVEAVHAMAPDAKIKYYAASSCYDQDFQEALGRVVDDNQAKIVSNSWGDAGETAGTAQVVAYQQIILQGAAQGISFLFSSGDSGDDLAATAAKQADFPATLPTVTAVGGTSTGIGYAGNRIFDTGWGTEKYSLSANGKNWTSLGFLYGAGGGYSALFNRPSYQNGVVPASAPAGRAVPDVAMDADPNTGMLVGQTQTFPEGVHYDQYRIGGTSLASPLFAGMTALAAQQNGGKGFGLLNPKLYQTKGIADDVTRHPNRLGVVRADYTNGLDATDGILYSVRTFDEDSSLRTVKGWDPVTGIGVPNANYFALMSGAAANPASAGQAAVVRRR